MSLPAAWTLGSATPASAEAAAMRPVVLINSRRVERELEDSFIICVHCSQHQLLCQCPKLMTPAPEFISSLPPPCEKPKSPEREPSRLAGSWIAQPASNSSCVPYVCTAAVSQGRLALRGRFQVPPSAPRPGLSNARARAKIHVKTLCNWGAHPISSVCEYMVEATSSATKILTSQGLLV